MKLCLCCKKSAENAAPSCIHCGEGSWGETTPIDPTDAPIDGSGPPSEDAVIEDAPPSPDQLAAATDDDLKEALSHKKLPPAWRKAVRAEVQRRKEAE